MKPRETFYFDCGVCGQRLVSVHAPEPDEMCGTCTFLYSKLKHKDGLLADALKLIETMWDRLPSDDAHDDVCCPEDDTCECLLPAALNKVHADIKRELKDG